MVKATKSNVFVKNLSPSITNKSLYDLFKDFGEIFSVKLALDYKGASKGYGYIQYYNVEDAGKAIDALNGKELDGKVLIVDLYKAGERRNADSNKFTNIFVKNLPSDIVDVEGLKKLFEKFGDTTSIGIFSQEYKGKLGYYGFANFSKAESAVAAVAEMNNKEISGSKLYVTRALTKDQREREKIKHKIELRNSSRKFTLHIKSAKGDSLTEDLIHQELDPYGNITLLTIQKAKSPEGTEVNTAIAYAVFSDPQEAERAASEYRKDGPLIVNLLEGKEQRREKMKQMFTPNRFDYSSMPILAMRGMDQPVRGGNRMQRASTRGRGRGMGGQRAMPRMPMRPMIPGFGMPGRMPMPMMPGPYPGMMPGVQIAMAPQMGPMSAGMPSGGMRPEMMAMRPGMMAMRPDIMGMRPDMMGMRPEMMPMRPEMIPMRPEMIPMRADMMNLIPAMHMGPQMMQRPPQLMQPPMMMSQPMVQPQSMVREDLGEQLYNKIGDIIDSE